MSLSVLCLIIFSLINSTDAQVPPIIGSCQGLQSPYTFRYVKAANLPWGCENTCFDPQPDALIRCGGQTTYRRTTTTRKYTKIYTYPTTTTTYPKTTTTYPRIPTTRRYTTTTIPYFDDESPDDYMSDCLFWTDLDTYDEAGIENVLEYCKKRVQKRYEVIKGFYRTCVKYCGNTKDCMSECYLLNGYNKWFDPSKTTKAESEWLQDLGCTRDCEEDTNCEITCDGSFFECDYICTRWKPSDKKCKGGYQKRKCTCKCKTCTETPNLKLCPKSKKGYINIPLRSGSYGWADPETGETSTVTSGRYAYGEYKVEPVKIGMTGTEASLIGASGVPIEGIGLHVGEASTVYINTVDLPGVVKPSDISVIFIGDKESVMTSSSKAMDILKLEFKVKNTTKPGQLNMTLKLEKSRKLIGEIKLKLDVQDKKDTLMDKGAKISMSSLKKRVTTTTRPRTRTTTTIKRYKKTDEACICNSLALPLIALFSAFAAYMGRWIT